MTTYVTYDTRSGRIISVHHGGSDENYAKQRAHEHSKIGHEYLAVLTVKSEEIDGRKQYKVDHAHGNLVEVAAGEGGVGFGFGITARTNR